MQYYTINTDLSNTNLANAKHIWGQRLKHFLGSGNPHISDKEQRDRLSLLETTYQSLLSVRLGASDNMISPSSFNSSSFP